MLGIKDVDVIGEGTCGEPVIGKPIELGTRKNVDSSIGKDNEVVEEEMIVTDEESWEQGNPSKVPRDAWCEAYGKTLSPCDVPWCNEVGTSARGAESKE